MSSSKGTFLIESYDTSHPLIPHPFQKQGYNTEEYADGSRYEGYFHNGERSGMGTYTYADGSTYTGEYLLDKKHGMGKETHKSNGDIYDGAFRYGKRHGHGVFLSPGRQRRYEGEWVEDVPHGKGTMQFLETADSYEGDFDHGVRTGQGKCFYADGGTYEGEWLNGLPHGTGVSVYSNGDRFRGLFDHGRRTTTGIYTPADLVDLMMEECGEEEAEAPANQAVALETTDSVKEKPEEEPAAHPNPIAVGLDAERFSESTESAREGSKPESETVQTGRSSKTARLESYEVVEKGYG